MRDSNRCEFFEGNRWNPDRILERRAEIPRFSSRLADFLALTEPPRPLRVVRRKYLIGRILNPFEKK